MKVCETCGEELGTKDGDNQCRECEDNESKARRAKARANRKAREQAMEDCGLVKVRGALGGIYWE